MRWKKVVNSEWADVKPVGVFTCLGKVFRPSPQENEKSREKFENNSLPGI
jgi:hypothetical protein